MKSSLPFRAARGLGLKFAFPWLMGAASLLAGAGPRAQPDGVLPKDSRLGPLRTYNDECTIVLPKTLAEWTTRAERLRRQILVAEGLWPMPAKTPLKAVITGRIDRPDYTVEKVYFESVPGFYVTGNLYRPKGRSGKLPGVLSPYGHWPEGRFTDKGPDGVLDAIRQGAERFEAGGRSHLQARCVQLARMGCVVFLYDMIGYGDATQLPVELAHEQEGAVVKSRPEMNTLENWGFFSPQAETHLESIMGLQTWDSVRALDFLLSLPEVDPDRVGCTGESGGGTQTFILTAIDDRVKVAFPAVMVSLSMQGGCSCENASDLRIGTSNLEMAALFAPKPMGLTSADDWTRGMAADGFPKLRRIYGLFGAEDQVSLSAFPQFKHNFNAVSRMPMYSWFNQQFHLGLREPVVERDYELLTKEEATVWDAAHPRPPAGPEVERQLLRTLTASSAQPLEGLSPDEFRKIAGPAVDVLIGRNLDEVGRIEWTPRQENQRDGYAETAGLLRNVTHKEELPAIVLRPERRNGNVVIWLEGSGKSSLYADDPDLRPRAEVRQLLSQGTTVVGVDLLWQGEFLAYGGTLERTRTVDDNWAVPAYTFCYNSSLFAQRVHDVLTAVTYARTLGPREAKLVVVGLNGAGPLVAAAVPQARGAITGAAIATAGFRFSRLQDVRDVNFLPGGAKYGDLPGLIALAGPTPVIQVDAPDHTLPSALQELLPGRAAPQSDR
jgi:dienelactone hydrolase